jgi:CubicO group peptidase (beta-lactamase class C family)
LLTEIAALYDGLMTKYAVRSIFAAFAVVLASAAVTGCGAGSTGGAGPFAAGYAPQTFSSTLKQHGSTISISGKGSNTALDNDVVSFMNVNQVANAELAVSSKGKVVFSHAYTFKSIAASTTATQTIMRLASNSKAWVDASMYNLISRGKVNPSAKVFAYLGLTTPLPAGATVDPRVFTITIQDMILHESGWDDSISPFYDPTFNMRTIATTLGLNKEVSQSDYVRYQLTQPLQEAPGTTYAYCNFCYTVLGMVIAKASHMTFGQYLATQVAKPLHLTNVKLSPTVGKRLPGEVASYYAPQTGLSAIYITSTKPYPYPYSGDGMALEVAGGASAVATNAESMLALMNKYIIWGVGTPEPGADWAREGSMPGTNSWAEQLPNGTNFSFIVNTRQYTYGSNPNAFEDLQKQFEQLLDPGSSPELAHHFKDGQSS